MNNNEALKLAVKMHKEFNSLSTEFDLEFELHEHMWFKSGSDICENQDNNKEDLFEGDGNTYGLDIRYIRYEDDDFLLAKVDNGCGDQYFALFLKEYEVSEYEDR